MKRLLKLVAGMATILFVPSSAFAHPMKGVGDFYAGLLHPVVTIETILPLVALGLLAGQQQRQTAIRILAAFPAAILLGTLLTLLRPVPSFIGTGTLGITAVLGLLIALCQPLPPAVPISMTVALGLGVGWTNASEIAPQMSPARFVAGLALSGLLLVTYGIGLVRHVKFEWSKVAVRVAGSWLAAIGILVLGLR